MGDQNDRRHTQELAAFRSAGTHFPFRNGWQVRLVQADFAGKEVAYEVSVWDPGYHPLPFSEALTEKLKKTGADKSALILAAVCGFQSETKAEEAVAKIAALLA